MPATVSLAPSKPAANGARKRRPRESNEANILRAAEKVFARAGFAGARVADIAAEAGIPKANLHYYFPTKRALYREVLANILHLWLAETDVITATADARDALERYIRAKMHFSRIYPDASRVFANEVIHGAPEIGDFLRTGLRKLVKEKSAVIERWIADGRMAPIDPLHLFFAIWATTQTYADFDAQVGAVLGTEQLSDRQFANATDAVVTLFLRGAGFFFLAPQASRR